jgi:hypothetical protein
MEHTKNDWFSFPCGHSICAECNDKMISHRFLSCPTCRTPREGVSQGQVDAANRARTERHAEQEGARSLVLRAGNQEVRVMFFPDESDGVDPFGVLGVPPPHRNPEADDYLLAQAVEAAAAVQSALPHLTSASGPLMQLDEPMQELVDQLLRPGTVQDFLAQREAARASQPRPRRRRSQRERRV